MFKNSKSLNLAFLVLIAANILIWQAIFVGEVENLELYFLDVGQGDSQLINLPDDVQILIDGGRSPQVLSEIARALAPGDRYIDLVVLTHPDFDHFGGLIDVLKTYGVGAVLTNGREGVAAAFTDFKKAIDESGLQEIVLREGDRIKYGDAVIAVLSPSEERAAHKKVNESGLVLLLEKGDFRVLYTADIGFETEQKLVKKYDLSAQVLKVGHHGSKFSSGGAFLKEIAPQVSVIEVGKNSYGHPTDAALNRLADIGSKIFRTDTGGTIKIIFDGEVLKIYN